MSVDLTDFANAITASLQDISDYTQTMSALASAIETYITNNLQIRFAWVAQYMGTLDPVTIAYGGISNLNVSLTLSNLTDKTNALAHIANEIKVSFQSVTYTITDADFVVTNGTFSDIPTLTISIATTTNRDTAMLNLADSILNWLTNYVPAQVVTGTHFVFVGTGAPNLLS